MDWAIMGRKGGMSYSESFLITTATRSSPCSLLLIHPNRRQMLLNGHDVNGMDYDRRTALMVAANKSNASIITMLLDAGADADMKDSTGSTALLDACKAGNEAAIGILTRKTRLAMGLREYGRDGNSGLGWDGLEKGLGRVMLLPLGNGGV